MEVTFQSHFLDTTIYQTKYEVNGYNNISLFLGPSRPYQCPQCPEKFDTESEANVHLVTCPGMNVTHVSSDTDDTSSLVTSLNTNTR